VKSDSERVLIVFSTTFIIIICHFRELNFTSPLSCIVAFLRIVLFTIISINGMIFFYYFTYEVFQSAKD